MGLRAMDAYTIYKFYIPLDFDVFQIVYAKSTVRPRFSTKKELQRQPW
jgi:hypothetical protein